MGRVVEGRPGIAGLEPEVGPAVDDDDVLGQLRGKGGRVAVRQGEEDHVVPGQGLGRGVLEPSSRQWRQLGMDRPEELTGAATRGHRPDLEMRVGEQEPEDLSAGIPARPRYCCPGHDA